MSLLVNKLAEYAHKSWSGWMSYLFQKSTFNDDGTVTIPKWAVDRWQKQMNTSYSELPPLQQVSDVEEAIVIANIVKDVLGKEKT